MLRKRWLWIGLLALAVILVGGGAWASRDQVTYAHIATGYAAKQLCSCMYVSGRTLDACVADYPEDARRNVTVAAEGEMVRASVLFGAISAEAVYEEGYGCRIVD